MTKLELLLADAKETYSPGESIQGKCVVTVKSKEDIQSLYLEIEGHSDVRWTEGTGDDSTSYSSHHSILEYKQAIFITNDATNHEAITLKQGRHEYPFNMVIPFAELPSSFKGSHGSIAYIFKAKIVRNFYPNITETIKLELVNPPSTLHPSYQFPVETKNEKVLCCCCCKSGPVALAFVVNKTAFQLGETIMISVDFTNHSNRQVTPKAKLLLHISFLAQGRTNDHTVTITSISGSPLQGKSESWNNQILVVPTELTNFSILNCPNIKVEYYVEVSLAISGSMALRVHVPVVIGVPKPYSIDPTQLPLNTQSPYPPPHNYTQPPHQPPHHYTQPLPETKLSPPQTNAIINQPHSSTQPSPHFPPQAFNHPSIHPAPFHPSTQPPYQPQPQQLPHPQHPPYTQQLPHPQHPQYPPYPQQLHQPQHSQQPPQQPSELTHKPTYAELYPSNNKDV